MTILYRLIVYSYFHELLPFPSPYPPWLPFKIIGIITSFQQREIWYDYYLYSKIEWQRAGMLWRSERKLHPEMSLRSLWNYIPRSGQLQKGLLCKPRGPECINWNNTERRINSTDWATVDSTKIKPNFVLWIIECIWPRIFHIFSRTSLVMMSDTLRQCFITAKFIPVQVHLNVTTPCEGTVTVGRPSIPNFPVKLLRFSHFPCPVWSR